MKKFTLFFAALWLITGIALGAWPTGSIDTQHLDQDTDSPLLGRPAIKQMADQVNAIRDNGAPQLAADMTTAATPGKGVLRDGSGRAKVVAGVADDDAVNKGQLDAKANLSQDGQVFTGRQTIIRAAQSGYPTAALQLESPNSDVYLSLANDLSAASLVHKRGASGFEARDTGGALARIKVAPGVASDDVLTKGQVYHGRVRYDGVALRLPAGWSCVRLSAGVYQITHNLGTANYSVVFGMSLPAGYEPALGAKSSGNAASFFNVAVYNHDMTQADGSFHFFVLLD